MQKQYTNSLQCLWLHPNGLLQLSKFVFTIPPLSTCTSSVFITFLNFESSILALTLENKLPCSKSHITHCARANLSHICPCVSRNFKNSFPKVARFTLYVYQNLSPNTHSSISYPLFCTLTHLVYFAFTWFKAYHSISCK